MPLTVTVTPGIAVSSTTVVDASVLNLLAAPTVAVTGTVDGSSAVSVADGTITTAKLAANAVVNAKLDTMATHTIKANVTAGTAVPTDVTYSALRDALGLTPDTGSPATLETSSTIIRVKDAGITAAKLAAKSVTSPKLDLTTVSPTIAANAATCDASLGLTFSLEPSDNLTVTLTFGANDEGKSILVRIKQPSAGSKTVTFSSSKTVVWVGGTTPALTTTANYVDLFIFTCIGTQLYAKAIQTFAS